ncbi:MAG: hypothetical protein QF907_07285 [Nitrospinota bacterium]|jgi:hypothetical protein|nr:hypothetical protein [Nitrospinota bacterium]MDP7580709.1 hypothetical protein [Nitrospinota bacterium]HJN03412.1 hypothetical protein [Nitrospinota bacterium]
MKNKKQKILGNIKKAIDGIGEGLRSSSTQAIQFELKELENVFCLLILGSFSGIPSPPAFLSLNLLPHLEKEIRVMLSRSKNIDDPLGDIFSVFDVG